MQHTDHVSLIKEAVNETSGVWADLGSGDGAFTLALADITQETVEIYSIDQDQSHLIQQKKFFNQLFPNTNVHYLGQDFTQNLHLPKLDGIIMANSLHYIADKVSFLQLTKRQLKPQGKIVIVEYNAEEGNVWVPYPISFTNLQRVAKDAGFSHCKLIRTIPSQFLEEIYSAVMI